MNTRSLLAFTGVTESLTGIALLVAPSLTATILLGAGLGSPESALVARVGGAGLLSIGVMCWISRNRVRDAQSLGLVAGLLVYNAVVAVLLAYAAVIDKMHGVGIWPAIGVHSGLLIWCAARLRQDAGLTRD